MKIQLFKQVKVFYKLNKFSTSQSLQPNPRHTSTQVQTQPQLHQSHFTDLLLSDLPMTPLSLSASFAPEQGACSAWTESYKKYFSTTEFT